MLTMGTTRGRAQAKGSVRCSRKRMLGTPCFRSLSYRGVRQRAAPTYHQHLCPFCFLKCPFCLKKKGHAQQLVLGLRGQKRNASAPPARVGGPAGPRPAQRSGAAETRSASSGHVFAEMSAQGLTSGRARRTCLSLPRGTVGQWAPRPRSGTLQLHPRPPCWGLTVFGLPSGEPCEEDPIHR